MKIRNPFRKREVVPTATTARDLWWVRIILNVGRPVVAVFVLVMCAPGEHYLARKAGWSEVLAWGMPATLTAYAGIAAVVATKRPKGAHGKATAVWGAIVSVLLAMAAQPVAHLYGRQGLSLQQIVLTVIVSCIPALVFGHLLHMAASSPAAESKSPAGPVSLDEIREPVTEAVEDRGPAGPVSPETPREVPDEEIQEIIADALEEGPGQYTGIDSSALETGSPAVDMDELARLLSEIGPPDDDEETMPGPDAMTHLPEDSDLATEDDTTGYRGYNIPDNLVIYDEAHVSAVAAAAIRGLRADMVIEDDPSPNGRRPAVRVTPVVREMLTADFGTPDDDVYAAFGSEVPRKTITTAIKRVRKELEA